MVEQNINAFGGGGGGGGGGPGGGRGGDGGSVNITHRISPEKVTIHDVKNPHREYFGMVLGLILSWIKGRLSEILIGVVIIVIGAIVLTWFGLKP